MIKTIKYIILSLVIFLFREGAKAQCPTLTIININNVSCFGGSDGSAQVQITPDPALPPCASGYSIMWSTGSNNASISGLASGIYFVNVTNNCTGCTSFAIAVIDEPFELNSTVTSVDAKCKNQASGIVDLEVTGGTPLYTYLWNNGATSQDLINVQAGTYSVTITDNNSCTTTNLVVVNEPASSVDNSLVVTDVNCFLGNDGAIDLTPFGGTPPYTFNWNTNTYLSEDITGLLQGAYNVVITDANGCVKTDNTVVQQPIAISTTIVGFDVLCNGDNTGNLDLTVSGGTPIYSYNWTSSSFTFGNVQDLNNIIADTYFVTVTDNNNCTKKDSIVIAEPLVLAATETHLNVKCYGGSDGSINISPTGGALPYTFQWSTSAGVLPNVTEDLTNIPPETYSVIITDNNGCTTSQTIIITQPLSPLTFNSTSEDVKCFGGNDGSIDISVTGGTLPYSYSWSNGAATEDLSNLFIGTYTVTIVDANGCIEIQSETITQPSAPISITQAITDVNCFGGADGSINLTTSGGTQPYTYSWINSSFSLSLTIEDVINFAADTYTVQIIDDNNCLLIDSFVINEPPKIDLTLSKTDILCFGNATGVVDLSVVGGVAPYQYLWSNGATTEDVINVVAGWYTVTVTDDHNCTMTDSVELTQPLAALSSFNFITPVTCAGGSDGAVAATVQDGTPPYSYLWSTGSTISALNNIPAGAYTLTTTDANGCILIDNVTVTEPDFVTITPAVTPVTCFGFNDGIIVPTVTGGTPSYNYDWTNSTFVLSSNAQNLSNLPPDFYTLIVTDTNGCTGSITVQVIEPALLELNPINKDLSCNGLSDGEIELNVTGGNPAYTYNWDNGANTSIISNLSPGTYTITLTDTKSCTVIDSIKITEPDPIDIVSEVTIVSCKDQADGIILLTPTGGNGGYTYLWSSGETDNPLTELAGGTFSVTVTDVLGCEEDTTILVGINPKKCLEIPNSFTPNGDGMNDTWIIDNLDIFDDASVKVFNEWGRIVFDGDGTSQWDGTFNGSNLPSGTYYYLITVLGGTEPYTGALTILR